MGAISLLQNSTFLPSIFSNNKSDSVSNLFKGSAAVKGDLSPTAPRLPVPEDTFQGNTLPTEDELSLLTYRSQMYKVALALQFRETTAQLAGGENEGDETTQVQSRQLDFSFAAEMREEELVLFQRRSQALADQMKGPRRESYIEASRAVAARFALSVKVSGAVLAGFTEGAETLQAADDASFDTFLDLVNRLLGDADEVLNELFGLVKDLLTGGGNLQARLTGFLENLQNSGLLGGFGNGTQGSSNAVRTQSFSMEIQLEFKFEYQETVAVSQKGVQESDPIVLDLDGDGIELTHYSQGARFDIRGNGQQVQTAFVTGGDAFLAMDRNDNGKIDGGQELFGDQLGAVNGFEELRKLDSNGDGRINKLDKDFDKLLLFKDNGNGITEAGELVSLSEGGVAEIDLGYRHVNHVAQGGNRLAQLASYLRADGTRGRAADAILNFIA